MERSFLEIREQDTVNLITLKGVSFEPEQISKIKNQMSRLIEQGKKNFVVDMGGLHVMNSTVSSMLIEGLKKATAAGGTVMLANVPERIGRQLETAKLASVFVMAETVDKALENLKAQPDAF